MEEITTGQGECKPRIDYPCLWQYKVITTDIEPVREIVADHLGDAPYSMSKSRKSRDGRYISIDIEMTVYSDYHRLRLYELLAAGQQVKVVL
jgi:hypothetical protein